MLALALTLLAAEPQSFRLQLELGAGVARGPLAQLGGGLELDWYPMRILRLHGSFGGSWISPVFYDESGAVKALAGVDGVLALEWGELFMGVESGLAYTNAEDPYRCDFCLNAPYSPWELNPVMRARAGLELNFARPLILGFDIGYELFSKERSVHWAVTQLRLGYAF